MNYKTRKIIEAHCLCTIAIILLPFAYIIAELKSFLTSINIKQLLWTVCWSCIAAICLICGLALAINGELLGAILAYWCFLQCGNYALYNYNYYKGWCFYAN